MRNALAIGVLLGILCAVVGSYLIVQQMSMLPIAQDCTPKPISDPLNAD